MYNAGFPLWFYRLRQPSGLFWAKKYNNFLFQVQSFVQDRFNEDIYLGANRGTHLLKEVGSGKMKRQRIKRRTEIFFAPFIGVRKMATDRANFADIRQPRKQLRPRRQIEQMSFPRSALQTSPPDDRITTKICTTCTYYREILSLRTVRSGRTIFFFFFFLKACSDLHLTHTLTHLYILHYNLVPVFSPNSPTHFSFSCFSSILAFILILVLVAS